MKKARSGVVGSVLIGIAFQCRDITAITIAVDHANISKGSVGKFLHGCLLDIGCYLHFQKAGLPHSFKDNDTKPLAFSVPALLFTCCWATEVHIFPVSLYHSLILSSIMSHNLELFLSGLKG